HNGPRVAPTQPLAHFFPRLRIRMEVLEIHTERDHTSPAVRVERAVQQSLFDAVTESYPAAGALNDIALKRVERRRIVFRNILSSDVYQRSLRRRPPGYLRPGKNVRLLPAVNEIPPILNDFVEPPPIKHEVNIAAEMYRDRL